MSHDAEHRRIKGYLEQLALAVSKEWKYCEADGCSGGSVYEAYYDDSTCETCRGAGEILVDRE